MKQRLLRQPTAKLDRLAPEELVGLDTVIGMVASKMVDLILPYLGIPYVHLSNATPAFLRDCYGWDIPVEIDARETWVVCGADAVIYSSAGMAALAQHELGVSARAVPFSVNLESARRTNRL